jgi:prolyl oligopeptidase
MVTDLPATAPMPFDYPPTRRQDLVETLHGVAVPDPYRWLESSDDPEVRAWTESQNDLTASVLSAVPGRERLRARLTELLGIGTISAPAVKRGRLFFTRREGRQLQPVLYWREGPDGEDRALVDPAVLEPDATAALDWWYPSPDGRLVAYGVSRSGDEKSVLSVVEVETGALLTDSIPHTRFCSLAWLPDSSGFYYTRYPTPGEVPAGDENYFRHVFFHRLGDDWRDDPKVFGEGRAREDMVGCALSPDGRWLLASASQGWAKNELYLQDTREPERGFIPVVEGVPALFLASVQNDRLYIRTNDGASRYRLFAVDPREPRREAWAEIIPESDEVLDAHSVVGGRLVCEYLVRASARLRLHRLDGSPERELELPALGSLFGWGGEWDGDELYYGFTSFATPPTVYRHHLPSGETALWEQVSLVRDTEEAGVSEVPAPVLNPDDYQVRQVEYPSRDGTPVTMFIVHRRDLPRDGQRPTLLYGYGGFNASMTPFFARAQVLLLERGGVYAVANLRGGGEYGEDWHRAGMLDRKQNVFDDCITAAEYLVREGYTSSERLAVQGGSNGGLLVGAAVTQRPDLFRAAVCQVPLLDMVRYHLFSIARLWIAEYGGAEDPEQFRWLHAYSPYHHVREGTRYPAMLITAAESDTRVDPLHARKFAAAIQRAQADPERPILLRIETKAGHGAGKPFTKQVDEATDLWSFLFRELSLGA